MWKKLWGVASEDVVSKNAAVKPPWIHGNPYSPRPKADAARLFHIGTLFWAIAKRTVIGNRSK
jgi:hypothetical protein